MASIARPTQPLHVEDGLTSFGFLDDSQEQQESGFALGSLFTRVKTALAAASSSDHSTPSHLDATQSTASPSTNSFRNPSGSYHAPPPAPSAGARANVLSHTQKASLQTPVRGLSNIDEHPESSTAHAASPPTRPGTADFTRQRNANSPNRKRVESGAAPAPSTRNHAIKPSSSIAGSVSTNRSHSGSSFAASRSSRALPLVLRTAAPAPAVTFTSPAVAINNRTPLAAPAGSYTDDRESVIADDGDMDPDASRDNFSILRGGAGGAIDRSHLAKHGWSAIPGFPLSKDILADDMRSVRSSSTRMPRTETMEDLPSRSAAQAGLQTSADAIVRRMRGEGLSRKFWMADENAKECRECLSVFTPFRRKHHCRICGQIFCGRCAAHIIKGKRFDYEGMIRVCNFCKRMLEEYDRHEMESQHQQKMGQLPQRASKNPNRVQPDKDMISAPLEALIKSPQAQFAANHLFASANAGPSAFQLGLPHMASFASALTHDGSDEERDEQVASAQAASMLQKKKKLESGSSAAPFRKGMDEDDLAAGPDPEVEVAAAQFVGSDVNQAATAVSSPKHATSKHRSPRPSSPTARQPGDKESPKARSSSPKISFPTGSTAEDAATNPAAIQSTSDYPRLRLVSETTRPVQRSRLQSLRTVASLDPAQASALIRSRFGTHSRVDSPLPAASADEEAAQDRSETPEFYQELRICPEGITPALIEASITYHALDHLRKMMEQTLARSGIPSVQKWIDVLLPYVLTTISRVKPESREDQIRDIREFVKIKRIPGGKPDDSEYVDGYVCTKHVATKKMAAMMPLTNARIIVIRFPLDYHRGSDQFMSLEPLIAQEQEFIRILVARIIALRPQIVVVEKTVSRTALELLEKEGIVVVWSVKADGIRAISRCTQADVITSIDRLTLDPRIGRCRFFNVETYQHASFPGWKKSFMRFEGTPKQLGCTIVLRGADGSKLSQVKKILTMMIFVAYNLRLEEHVMADEGAAMETIYSDNGPINGCLPCGTLDGVPLSPSRPLSEEVGLVEEASSSNGNDSKSAILKARARILRALTTYQTTLITSSACINIPAPFPILRLKEESDRLMELLAEREAEELERILKDEGKLESVDAPEPAAEASTVSDLSNAALSENATPTAEHAKEITPQESSSEESTPKYEVPKPRLHDTILEETEEANSEPRTSIDGADHSPREEENEAKAQEETKKQADNEASISIETASPMVSGANTTTPTPRVSSPEQAAKDAALVSAAADASSVKANSAPASEVPTRTASPGPGSVLTTATQSTITQIVAPSALTSVKQSGFDLFSLLKAPSQVARDAEFSIVLERHKVRMQEWSRYLDVQPESVSPFNHKRLQIIVTRHCTLASKPCDGPKLESIEFYGDRDETLGGHIERLAANSAKNCSAKGCGKNNVLHYNTYTHNQVRIQVVLERFVCPLPNEENRLLSWSYCKVCENATPVAFVTAETWSFSFVKYLELYFYRHDHCKTKLCDHDFYRDQVRYFAYHNMAVRFHSEVVELYEVEMPEIKLFIDPAVQCNIKNEETAAFVRKNQAYWDSVVARIRALGNDACSDAAGTNKDKNRGIISDMFRRCEIDRKEIESLIGELYEYSPATDVLCLNQARRVLQEKVVKWDVDFIEFEKNCIPSEKDIRRITTTHLKRLFSEKDSSEVRSDTASSLLPPAAELDETLSQLSEGKSAVGGEESSTSGGRGVSSKAAEALGLAGADLSALPMLPDLLSNPVDTPATEDPPSIRGEETAATAAEARGQEAPGDANAIPMRSKTTPALTIKAGRTEPKPFRDGNFDDETDVADMSPVEARPMINRRSLSNPVTAPASPTYTFNKSRGLFESPGMHRADESSCTESELVGAVSGLIRRFDSPKRSITSPESNLIGGDAIQSRNIPSVSSSRRPSLRRGKTEEIVSSQPKTNSMRKKGTVDEDEEDLGSPMSRNSPATRNSRLPRAKRHDSGGSIATIGRRSGTVTPNPSTKPPTQPVPPPSSYKPPKGEGLRAGPRPIIGRSGASASIAAAASRAAANATSSEGPSTSYSSRLGSAAGGGGAQAGSTLSVYGSRVPVARRGENGPGTRSRVSTIAKHFDRISKEAERERERQHRLLLAQRAKRARPVAMTRARVEVFNSVREAVRDDESEAESAAESSGDDSASAADNEEDEEDDSDEELPSASSPRMATSGGRRGHEGSRQPDGLPKSIGSTHRALTQRVDEEASRSRRQDGRNKTNTQQGEERRGEESTDEDKSSTIKGKAADVIANAAAACASVAASLADGAGTIANHDTARSKPSPIPASELESDAQSIAASSMTTSNMPLTLPSYLRNGFTSDSDSMPSLEKSFLKTLSGFWAFRTGDMVPLEYPMLNSEHVFADSDIIFREDEPTSIVAFTLSSTQYKDRLKGMRSEVPRIKEKDETFMPGIESGVDSDGWGIVDVEGNELEGVLKKEGRHFRCEFESGSTRLWCKILFAEQFDALRRTCGCDLSVIESLSRCFKWDSSGGKSGSAFMKTRDHRFVVKQMSRFEMDAFSKFAPQYFNYMSQCISKGRRTTLAKIFGCFRIGFRNPQTGKSLKLDCFVMENLFYGLEGIRSYDLKGSTRNRYVQETGKDNEVLLDENLLESNHLSPMFIREHSKRLLRASLYNDSLFLADMNVMDYSLMVGIDKKNNRLVVGIIDFVRTYTWDKRVESFVKETALLGGAGKGEPTIITPPDYRTRFLTFIDKGLLLMPDHWVEEWAL